MITTSEYKFCLPVPEKVRIAVAADIHSTPHFAEILRMISDSRPDAVFIPGDLCHDGDEYDIPLGFLRSTVSIAPVYYSFGNHERSVDETVLGIDGVHLLNDRFEMFKGIVVGGLRSGFRGQKETNFTRTPKPDLGFIDEFEKICGVKLLLSHHPEYYPEYLSKRRIDLIFSCHAHGGQWRFFGRGLFAPGQGFFPKYTSGIYGNMIVSRGLANKTIIPRLFNSPELVLVDIFPENN